MKYQNINDFYIHLATDTSKNKSLLTVKPYTSVEIKFNNGSFLDITSAFNSYISSLSFQKNIICRDFVEIILFDCYEDLGKNYESIEVIDHNLEIKTIKIDEFLSL